MSFFGVGNPFSTPVGQKIEQATDGLLPSENWALNMEICDLINASPEAAKDAIKAIRKRLTQSAGKNYTVVMYTLTVLETCVKNCGKPLHVLACHKEFISELVKLIGPKNDPPTIVQDKVLSLIQCWADAFQTQPDLQGVVLIYNELKQKGVEFPMTDLDAMAPIFTPQRSVPDGAGDPAASPQRVGAAQSTPSIQLRDIMPQSTDSINTVDKYVTLTPQQTSKLFADLAVVEGNMAVMADMLNELTAAPPPHHPQDLKLLDELAEILVAMQERVAALVARLAGDAPLTAALLAANDQLNNLLLRYQRAATNRNKAAMSGKSPAAALGAAMGVPMGSDGASKSEDDALIDLSDDVPDITKLTVKDPSGDKSPGSSKDEFDMFAQSRNLTYENSKTGGSSYADNLEEQSSSSLVAAANQRATQGAPLPTGMDQREIDEIAAWLEQEKAAASTAEGAQESVTSSDFDKFLAERAAAADNLPNANDDRAQNTPQQTPRHRQIKKEEPNSMFAL
ncbi:target of Myb protein 1 isoform X1 [Plutella xylostella]|uniref:target of Myb protein 1 isoform X1 n=1 Tax=Plutella xylostella TaxID=51655 RepID=UPI00203303C7|nr:target of Myb protein 1 isoform X1 [Plutella xylostella]